MKKIGFIWILAGITGILLTGCGSETQQKENFILIKNFSVEPASSTLYGNIKITIHSTSFPPGITSVVVKIADNKLYEVEYKSGTITGFVQGNDKAGKYSIKIFTNKGNFLLKNSFEYLPLKYPMFRKMVSIGASYTHGFISMGLDWELQQYSPFAQVAKQAGAYFPQALVRKGILPPQPPETLLSDCTATLPTDILLRRILNTLKILKNEKGKNVLVLATYRKNPDIQTYNAGIGGATILDTVEGPRKGRIPALAVLENLSFYPYIKIYNAFSPPPSGSPANYAANLHPTIVFSTDLYADDILEFALLKGTPSLEDVTPVETVKKELNKLFTLFQNIGAQLFIANMPDITAMPILSRAKNSLLWKGYAEEDVEEWWNGLKKISAEYSKAFTEVAEKFENVHIVDFRGYIEKIESSKTNGNVYKFDNGVNIESGGVKIGDEIFTPDYLGGLVSLDAVHLTYTGYALIADMFIEVVNKELGYDIPYIDLETIAGIDPLTPDRLKELGIDIEECREEFLHKF